MQKKPMRRESAKQVAIDVLRTARKPLHTKEIARRVVESGRCSGLKGKTPEATIAATLAVGSRPGGPFKRVDKGTYALSSAQVRPAATKRPAARRSTPAASNCAGEGQRLATRRTTSPERAAATTRVTGLTSTPRARMAGELSRSAGLRRSHRRAPHSKPLERTPAILNVDFFFPDSQDQVDTSFDFERESSSPDRVRQRDDRYAHEVISPAPYTGILLSKALVDGPGSKYTFAQRHRLSRLGVCRFFRLDECDGPPLATLGDCGAFNFVREDTPPYSVDDVVDFYDECAFDYGISVDM